MKENEKKMELLNEVVNALEPITDLESVVGGMKWKHLRQSENVEIAPWWDMTHTIRLKL